MNNLPGVTVIVVNYNGSTETIECINSILSGNMDSYELSILVIDNASDKNDLQKVSSFIASQKKCRLIKSGTNLGFTGGNNLGIKEALESGADYIFILNNDTVLEKNTINNLLKFLLNKKETGIAGPKIYFSKGYEFHKDRYTAADLGKVFWSAGGVIDWMNVILSNRGVDEIDSGQYDEVIETDFVSGCAMLVPSAVFKKIGLFDDKYFVYLEDVDFCLRAKRAGVKLFYNPDSVLWHKNASSSGKPGSSLHVYYQTRNRLYFGMKYAGLRTKFALLREALRNAFKNSISKKALVDFLTIRMGKGEI